LSKRTFTTTSSTSSTKPLPRALVAAGGGRFVVRGGELAVLEGDWHPSRLVVLEFEDLETAKQWYASDEYQEVMKLRAGAARLNIVAVQGV